MITLEQLTGLIREIPLLPPTASRLAAVLSSPLSTIDDCVGVIRYDQALTLQALRQANSAFSGAAREITDVRDAVIRLGGGRILREFLAVRLTGDLAPALPAYGYPENDLWRHSVAAAIAAEELGAFSSVKSGGLVFTAALLHDIGKLILARAAPRADMDAIWKKVSGENCSCEAAERAVLGFSHADAGAALIETWELPGSIVSAVRGHHAHEDTGDPMTDWVMVANMAARSAGEGIGNEGLSTGMDPLVAKRLGITKDIFEQLCARTIGRMRKLAPVSGE